MVPSKPQPPASGILLPVFAPSALLLGALLIATVAAPQTAITWLEAVKSAILTHAGWFYVLTVTAVLVFCVVIAVSPLGSIRLGADDEQPQYSRFTWSAMLFAAGMGIGLVVYGVAEPMAHFRNPPSPDVSQAEALANALPLSFHHWGLHAWGAYALLGATIALFAYRLGLPLALRSCFYPLLGDRIYGWPGHLVDIAAVFGTLFGLATSLGAGAASVSAGLNQTIGTPDTVIAQLVIIAGVTCAAIVSLVAGLDNGVKRLSEINLLLAATLLILMIVLGPTISIGYAFVEGVGLYFGNFFERSFALGMSDSSESAWVRDWSVVYWGWWLAWAPFVGVFIARISRGRTLRDLIISTLIIPVAMTFIWFAAFGGTALSGGYREVIVQVLQESGSSADAVAVYALLEQLPFGGMLSLLAIVVVLIFFVSSSDSASYVVDMLTSGGHPDPPVWTRIFWGVAEGATAGVLLYTGGQEVLKGLKAGVVSAGLPIGILLFLMCASLALHFYRTKLQKKD